MTFNDNITIDTSGSTRGRGRRAAGVGGGIGGLGLLGVLVFYLLTGQLPDPSALSTGDTTSNQSQDNFVLTEECKTGEDANTKSECRMVAGKNSLDTFWKIQLPSETGYAYSPATLVVYSGVTDSGCGTASNQIGPFYCPADSSVYIDVDFFNQLKRFGTDNSSIAQLYILAHEWGHHVQNLTGVLAQVDHNSSGPTSSMVRSELQADCLAGAWIHNAANTVDPDTGVPFLKMPTEQQLRQALSAAAAVGDDRIAQNAGVNANPDNFSHGSAQKRQEWLMTGIKGGSYNVCDTWSVRVP